MRISDWSSDVCSSDLALDPSSLISLPTALHALNAAIADCRNAGRPHHNDPAVILLARHLGAIAAQIERLHVELRRACMDAIAELRCKPALVALAHTGVGLDEPPKTLVKRDARKGPQRPDVPHPPTRKK